MLYLETSPNTFAPWQSEPINGTRYSRDIAKKWSPEKLEAIGLYKPEPADVVPEGKIVTGQSVQRVEGVVKWVHELADAPTPEPQQIIEGFRAAIQQHVDQTAIAKLYDSGNSLATYVSSTVPQWAAEAAAFVAWRDAVWAYAYAEMDKVLGGLRAQPTIEDFLAELPEIEWPDAA